MGFFSRPIILFGIATIEEQRVVVRQFLVRNMEEELPALDQTLHHLREKQVVVSYNGKTFDIPYLFSRSAFYGGTRKDHATMWTCSMHPGVTQDTCCRTAGSVP